MILYLDLNLPNELTKVVQEIYYKELKTIMSEKLDDSKLLSQTLNRKRKLMEKYSKWDREIPEELLLTWFELVDERIYLINAITDFTNSML